MKKTLALLLTLVLSMTTLSAFVEELLDGGVTNPTGLPIVNEPITLDIAVWFSTGSGDYEDRLVLQQLQEATGITFNYIVYTEQEKVKLMYAAQDYPDISWRLDGSDVPKLDAIEAGDVLMLDDYMQYAPNITKFFEEYPGIKLQATHADGHLYAFPYAHLEDVTFKLRDGVWINRVWLDELGLEIPTTIDELMDVLYAFKDNAGTGTIPQDVIPYYMYYPSAIGGVFDFICSFGVYVFDGNWEAVIDKVYHYQAINPEIKEPIKYLAQMYADGLLPASMFTDTWNEYYNNYLSDPPLSGIVAGYTNAEERNYALSGYYYPMAPVQTDSGKAPYTRTQSVGASFPTNFMIYANNEYPVASVRLADYMCDPDVVLDLDLGAKGHAWDYNEDGMPELIPSFTAAAEENLNFAGLHNMGLAMLDVDASVINPAYEVDGSRAWAIRNVYADYTADYTYPKLPTVQLEDMENDRLNDLKTELSDYVNSQIARWIIGEGDVDAEWDGYVEQMRSIGVEEYIELQQKKLDMAYALGDA